MTKEKENILHIIEMVKFGEKCYYKNGKREEEYIQYNENGNIVVEVFL